MCKVLKSVVCVQFDGLGDFAGDDLTIGRMYEVVEENAGHGMARVLTTRGRITFIPLRVSKP